MIGALKPKAAVLIVLLSAIFVTLVAEEVLGTPLTKAVSFKIHGDYVAAGVGLRNRGYGDIGITGIPSGSTIQKAFLYWTILAPTEGGSFKQGEFDGHLVEGTFIGSDIDPCWDDANSSDLENSWSYRADVTQYVSGNGTYHLSNFASYLTTGEDPWTENRGLPPMIEGASLVVIYSNSNLSLKDILVYEGNDEFTTLDTIEVTISGFEANGQGAKLAIICADGQDFPDNNIFFNDHFISVDTLDGGDAQAGPAFSSGNLWDTDIYDVKDYVASGDLSSKVAFLERTDTGGAYDCLVLVALVLSVEREAANQPPDTKIETHEIDSVNGTAKFTWSGSDDSTPTKDLLYCYRLVRPGPSYDEWSSWGKGTTKTYSGLTPGNYKFEVRAKDEDDAIDPSPASKEFVITEAVNNAPIARASNISGQPNDMHPDTAYTVTAKYFDPDGRDNLKICYLQLKHPEKRLTMMWYQEDGHTSTYVGEEGENYLSNVNVTPTEITDDNGNEGYELTWSFQISDQWPEVEDAIDFGVFASDDGDLESNWDYDSTNASFVLKEIKPVLISRLKVTPEKDTYYVGDKFEATFTIKNSGDMPITLSVLTVGGRDPDGLVVDFEWKKDITLDPNEEYTYTGGIILPYRVGKYHFFCAYQNPDGTWNTNINLAPGLTDSDRIKDITIDAKYYLIGAPHKGRGGIVIPKEAFPEGKGKIIPIFVPPVVDDSNAIFENGDWQTIKTIEKAESDFDWAEFFASLTMPEVPESEYINVSRSAFFSIASGLLLSAEQASSRTTLKIMVQRNSQGALRAIVQIADADANTGMRSLAGKGWRLEVLNAPIPHWDYVSKPIYETFHLQPDCCYAPGVKVDSSHKDDEYIGYLSFVHDNKLTFTPKIYREDGFKIVRGKEVILGILIQPRDIFELRGDGYLSLFERPLTEGMATRVSKILASTSIFFVSEPGILSKVKSPVELRVHDSMGNVTGVVAGQIREEIPNSFYDSESKAVVILSPTDLGSFRFEAVGTEKGTYGLEIAGLRVGEANTFAAANIPTSANAMHEYTINWSALSQGKEGVMLQVDSDGDGIVDRTVTTGGTLTGEDFGVIPAGESVNLGPNPVTNAGTAFFYALPEGTSTAKLMIFNIAGRPVFETSLDVNSTRFPSAGTWNPVDQNGIPLANGPYVYVLIADGKVIGKGKMVIQR